MASDPRIEAVADALRRLDGEPEAPLVSYGDDARFVLAAADAVDPLRDRDRMLPIIKQAQHEWATHFAAGGTRPLSDFVFDALTGNDE